LITPGVLAIDPFQLPTQTATTARIRAAPQRVL
jgi:hypothetical protein